MPRFTTIRHFALANLSVLLIAGAAFAHHGWSWAEGELATLTGTITQIAIAPPHPELLVEDADGVVWTIELGNPGRTQRSGFVEGVAQQGDSVTVLGNQSQDRSEAVMKAVRITVEGRQFDMYPERIPSGS